MSDHHTQAAGIKNQAILYPPPTVGYGQYVMPDSFAQPGSTILQAQEAYTGVPMVVRTSHNTHVPHHARPTLGTRLRHFFCLAPSTGVRYKSDYHTWGFMGYSRRRRYVDVRTGGEVDRKGRPVYRA